MFFPVGSKIVCLFLCFLGSSSDRPKKMGHDGESAEMVFSHGESAEARCGVPMSRG